MGVDWEERVDFDRLRTQRLGKIKNLLQESELGALLCFPPESDDSRNLSRPHRVRK